MSAVSRQLRHTCAGCILGELLGGKPIFPGTSTMNQLDRILEVTGRPSAEDIDAIQSPFAATMLDSLPQSDPRPLHHMFPNASPEATDLLSKLLQVRPMIAPSDPSARVCRCKRQSPCTSVLPS